MIVCLSICLRVCMCMCVCVCMHYSATSLSDDKLYYIIKYVHACLFSMTDLTLSLSLVPRISCSLIIQL